MYVVKLNQKEGIKMKIVNLVNNYKGVILFYIIVAILSFLIVINNNRINELNYNNNIELLNECK